MTHPVAVQAMEVAPRARPSSYPPEFAVRMAGRVKRALGDVFGLRNFGVNLTELAPGAASALHHRHSRQDEFIFLLEGQLVLVTGDGEETPLQPGNCAGFPAGGPAHHLENRGTKAARFLELGDRTEGDEVSYPTDDLVAVKAGVGWRFRHKDGRSY